MSERGQPVFLASTSDEAEAIETLLDGEGIDYDLLPEASARSLQGAACYQGLLFEVHPAQAEHCRRLLRERGFSEGVVEGT